MRERITELISKYLLSKESNDELLQLNEWRNESDQNAKILTELDSLWQNSADMVDYHEFDTDQAWNTFEQKIQPEQKTRLLPLRYIGIAASFLLLAMLGYQGYKDAFNTNKATKLFTLNTEAQVISNTLQDNSLVWLNENSTLKQKSSFDQTRTVTLDGQAYFEIQRDPSRTFEVHTESAIVRVLGTAFDLKAYGDDFDLHVTHGFVEVETPKRTYEVSKNHRLTKVNGDYAITDIFDDSPLQWRNSGLIFKNATLTNVIAALESHFSIQIENPKALGLNKCSINTTFEHESIDEIFEELHLISQLKVEKSTDKIYTIQSINCD